MRISGFCILVTALALSPAAHAQEQTTPLAVDGDWAAMSHSVSVTAPPDVCVAAAPSAHFGIRIDDSGDIEFRLTNDSWSLPANVTGSLVFAVNGSKYSFDITGNTSEMVAASVTQDQLLPILADMEKANAMTVTAGSAAPETIPLDGSTNVLTAFLTCAGISPPSSNTGGSNPFATKSSQ